MKEYIEREAVKHGMIRYGFTAPDMTVTEFVEDELPAADVVEVRHGEWVWKRRHHGGFRKYMGVDEFGETHTITVDERSECDEPYCPYCGKWNESVFRNYCPNCGAKMDGGDE